MSDEGPIVFFDGVCAVCNHLVLWLLDHGVDPSVRFAPLQGPTAERMLVGAALPPDLDSIVVLDRGKVTYHTAALVSIASYLPAPWRWAGVMRWIPGPLRDFGYKLFARVRYRVFGKVEMCRLVSEAEEARMLD